MQSQHPTKRRKFVVSVPVWTDGNTGRDVTLSLLRETLNESFTFGVDSDEKHWKPTVTPLKEST